MKNYKTLTPAYDVSGGDKDFDSIAFEGKEFLEVQFFFSDLDESDHKLRLQESLDGNNFVDSKDSDGNTIEIVIDNALEFDILKVLSFNTVHFRFQFIKGTTGTGTIDKLKIMME